LLKLQVQVAFIAIVSIIIIIVTFRLLYFSLELFAD